MNTMIYVSEPSITSLEKRYVLQCLKQGYISGTGGHFVREFEERFSRWCGCRYGIATTSGTTSLHLMMSSYGIGPGDEVIVQSLTNIATAYSVLYNGARVIPIDSERFTWNIDPDKIERSISRKTKAIVVVHLYGHPVNIKPVIRLAKKYKLYLFEDAAEAHGATCYGRKVGSLGDAACFSFYSNKIITTGEGGMIVTNNKKVYEKAQLLKNLAFAKKKRFFHYHIGYNYRMPNIQAAIGLAQLERVNTLIKKKKSIAKTYNNWLGTVEGLTLPPNMLWADNVYWMYGILVEKSFGVTRDQLMQKLLDKGIETRRFFVPIHKQPIFRKMGLFQKLKLPVSEELSQKGLYLPSGPVLKAHQIAKVAQAIIELKR